MHKKPPAVFSLKISQSQPLKIFCMYDPYCPNRTSKCPNRPIFGARKFFACSQTPVCCLLWLYFHRYLLRNQTKLDNVVLHTDPKSTTLGPQLIFISKFLEKAPFLAQNAYFNYRLEFEKDENTIDNTCPYFLFYEL